MEKAIERGAVLSELNDRRKSERVDLVVRVTYRTVDELFSEFAHNINEGGIFIETDDPQEVGTSVALQFNLPGNERPVEVDGVVIRTSHGEGLGDPSGMGIEFGNLSDVSRRQINEIVQKLRAGTPG